MEWFLNMNRTRRLGVVATPGASYVHDQLLAGSLQYSDEVVEVAPIDLFNWFSHGCRSLQNLPLYTLGAILFNISSSYAD
jgi:hypothetical protein